MTLTYEEALATLQSMFSSYSPSELDAALRQYHGHMERTVEYLLGQSEPPPPPAPRRRPPTTLPEDFLRIPTSSTVSDEQLARMLQDELFREELRNNPEFSHLAAGGVWGRSNYDRGATAPRGAEPPLEGFLDKLSELGDTAKRRLQELASHWSGPDAHRQGQGTHPILRLPRIMGSAGQTNSSNSSKERRGLLAGELHMQEDEEEEMNFVGGRRSAWDSGEEAVELKNVTSGRTAEGNGSKKKD